MDSSLSAIHAVMRCFLLACACVAACCACCVAPAMAQVAPVVFHERFGGDDRLLTNEYAHWNPQADDAVRSAHWTMVSGSVFVRSGRGWTGSLDATAPDARSLRHTNSAIFRLRTRREFSGTMRVALRLRITAMGATKQTPRVAWDGVHLPVRWQASGAGYFVTMHRRDGVLIIKKRTSAGTYCTLSGDEVRGARPIRPGVWEQVEAAVRTRPDGAVELAGRIAGEVVVTAVDVGGGDCGAPIHRAGATGIRSDNVDASFDDLLVRRGW